MANRNTSIALLVAASGWAVPLASWAQTDFTEVTPTTGLWATNQDEDFWVNAVAPADIDGDGDIDLAMIGFYVVYFVSSEDRLVLLMNEGPDGSGHWAFTEVPVPLGDLWAGASDLAWGDYDGDGDDDLAVASEGAMALYRNDAGQLTQVPTDSLPYWEDSSYDSAYDLRSITWADVDNDNDLDMLVPSVFDEDAFEYSTRLLRNDGATDTGGWSFTDMGAAIDPTVHAQSAWADDDGDLDLDLFLTNVDPYTETGFIRRFGNDGGSFTGEQLLGIEVNYGLADWGDFDADGDLDILVAGNILETDDSYSTVVRVYRNDGGIYAENTLLGDWLDVHAATWADYDSDGDVDLLVTGSFVDTVLAEIVGRSKIYVNEANEFTDSGVFLPAPISSVGRGGSFTWFDLDGDGDLDYFVAGAYYVPGGNGLVAAEMHLFSNAAPGLNAVPDAPGSPEATPDSPGAVPALHRAGPPIRGGTAGGLGVTLTWQAATDDHTPSPGLTYDLRVRPEGAAESSAQRLPQPGNVGAATSWRLEGLPEGAYEWSVQAIDSALAAGAKAEGRFTLGVSEAPDGGDGLDDSGTGPGASGDGGCSCRVASRRGAVPPPWLLSLLTAGILLRSRRHRRRA